MADRKAQSFTWSLRRAGHGIFRQPAESSESDCLDLPGPPCRPVRRFQLLSVSSSKPLVYDVGLLTPHITDYWENNVKH